MTFDQFNTIAMLMSATGAVICFALGYLGGYAQ